MDSPADEHHLSRRSRIAVRLLALLGAAALLLYFGPVAADTMGLVDLEARAAPDDPPPSAAARAGAARPGEAVHLAASVAAIFILCSGLIALAVRPESDGYGSQALASVVALFLASLVVGNPDNYGGQAGVVDPAFAVLGLPALGAALLAGPWRSWRIRRPRHPRLMAAAVVAGLPALWYGVGQALAQRNTYPPSADPHHNGHWFAAAAVAFTISTVLAAACFSGRGWSLGAISVGLTTCLIAVASWLSPSSASALGPLWTPVALLLGVLVLLITVQELRRPQDRNS